MSRPTLVIGDVHGRSDLLRSLITAIHRRYGLDVDLFSTGDLIDRGPDSKDVVQLCIDHGIMSIIGNHETWMHQYLATGQFDSFALHKMMSGRATLQSYGVESTSPGEIERTLKYKMPKAHVEYFLRLPMWRKIEVEGRVFFLNHAAVKKDAAFGRRHLSDEEIMNVIAKESPASILWTSNSFKNPQFWHFKTACQVFGHSPTYDGQPIITPHWIAVDSGCGVRRALLSAVELGTGEVLQAHPLSDNERDSDGFTDMEL